MRACSSSFLTTASASSRRRRAPASSPASNRCAAATSARRTDPSTSSTGVNFRASADSSAADCGAPRAAAAAATSSSTSATTSSGPCVARARCRALSSRSSTVAASLSWVSRRRVEEADVYTADANNGCVNRIPSPSSETSPESIAGFSVPSVPGPSPDAAARSAKVGRAAAAVVRSIWRVGSGSADIRSTRRARRSSGRGRVSPTSGGPLRASSRAISRAKNGFPLAAS